MSLGALDLALALGLPLVLGLGLVRALGLAWRTDPLACLGWAWIGGTLATGSLVFAWLWTAPDTGSPGVPRALVAGAALACLALGRRVRAAEPSPGAFGEAPRWERGLFYAVLALVALLTLTRIVGGTLVPVLVDDEADFWALKAKVIFDGGGFTERFADLMSAPYYVYNKDYPLLNPLLQVWTFVQAGEITHVANRLPIQVFALAQVALLAAALRRCVRPAIAAGLVVLAVATADAYYQTQRGQGDLMVGLGLVAALAAWLRWRARPETAWARLGALALAFALWSKNEGTLMVAALVVASVAVALWRRPRAVDGVPAAPGPRAWPWLVLPAAVFVVHTAFNARFGFQSGFLANPGREGSLPELFFAQLGSHGPAVLRWYAERILLDPAHANLLLLAFVLLAAGVPRLLRRRELLVPAVTLALVYAGTIVVFVGGPHDVGWHLRNAANRICYQPIPAVTLWVGAALGIALASARGRPRAAERG